MPTSKTHAPTHLVVGAGRMGGALISGWVSAKPAVLSPRDILILDPRPGDEARICIQNGATHITEPSSEFGSVDYVLLAIKPQMFEALAHAIAEHLKPGSVVISILAGTSLSALQKVFNDQHIIRAMPNTPASIGAGITAFTATSDVTDAQKEATHKLLKAGGQVHEVENEHLIDVVTAVSGSGPAYFFHMVEALQAAAIQAGLPENIAPDFARQTLIGAGALLAASPYSATELRQAVTSPKGTTEAALDVLMDANGLSPLMRETVKAALKRAKELA